MSDFLDRVAQYAEEKHSGQKRKFNGEPYINHPKRVALTVQKYTKDENVVAAAWLHDVLEDTQATPLEIEKLFGKKVATIVDALTSNKEESKALGKKEYLAKKIINLNSDALLVKLADRLDNISDLSLTINSEWSEQYADQTFYIMTQLKLESLEPPHKQLVDSIYQIMKGNGFCPELTAIKTSTLPESLSSPLGLDITTNEGKQVLETIRKINLSKKAVY
jgi:(p)ppGpp synthase/HD superfamily hydrolase